MRSWMDAADDGWTASMMGEERGGGRTERVSVGEGGCVSDLRVDLVAKCATSEDWMMYRVVRLCRCDLNARGCCFPQRRYKSGLSGFNRLL